MTFNTWLKKALVESGGLSLANTLCDFTVIGVFLLMQKSYSTSRSSVSDFPPCLKIFHFNVFIFIHLVFFIAITE